jgi:excisionase family DNA binding protein
MSGEQLTRLLGLRERVRELSNGVDLVRRLVFERRIAYVKVGRHVRISEHDLSNYVATARVEADRRLGA